VIDPIIADRICAAKAHIDQLVAMQRDVFMKLRVMEPGVTHDELLAAMIGMMMADPPDGMDEVTSLAAVAILAVDRLANQPSPQVPG
jgi:hypothetical protein